MAQITQLQSKPFTNLLDGAGFFFSFVLFWAGRAQGVHVFRSSW